MKYAGKYTTKYSTICGETVDILEYKSKDKTPYCTCSRCGKPITKKMHVVQSHETGVELIYLGPECIKKFT